MTKSTVFFLCKNEFKSLPVDSIHAKTGVNLHQVNKVQCITNMQVENNVNITAFAFSRQTETIKWADELQCCLF